MPCLTSLMLLFPKVAQVADARLIILEELFEPIFDNPIRLLTDQSIRRLPQGLFEFISERWILCHLFESAAQDRNSVWLNARRSEEHTSELQSQSNLVF